MSQHTINKQYKYIEKNYQEHYRPVAKARGFEACSVSFLERNIRLELIQLAWKANAQPMYQSRIIIKVIGGELVKSRI